MKFKIIYIKKKPDQQGVEELRSFCVSNGECTQDTLGGCITFENNVKSQH